MTTTTPIPQHPGEFSPAEADAFMSAQIGTENRAGIVEIAAKALAIVDGCMSEWSARIIPLHRRWEAIDKMLAGNTLDKGGIEDVHVPEIYKALETIIPRMEETVVGLYDPFFRMVPRRRKDVRNVNANSAYIDWEFSQAKVRTQIQPALRDMVKTQACIWYCWWENEQKYVTPREVKTHTGADGRPRREIVAGKREKKVTFAGPKAKLVRPQDFIIDTKYTDPQTAPYVGHRWWMTADEIRQVGKLMEWKNLDMVGREKAQTMGPYQDAFGWSGDPTSRYGLHAMNTSQVSGRPDKLEVVVLYVKAALDSEVTSVETEYRDTRIVVVGGKTVVEVRDNPLNGELRPYAISRVSKSGHHFYSTGPFDNAIRLNQHLDRYHQLFLRGAHVTAMPLVFAEDDGDLPDSLNKAVPGKIYKGVGAVRFTTIPDGFLRAAPMVIGMLQRNIEETTGAFRVNMGQDTGGTASEAQLAFQEGNRRLSGMVRSFGEGLTQLLAIFHKLNRQFSTTDVEFPVLGKRALDLKKSHMTLSPADLIDDVEFEIIGLRNARNYGLKATGIQAFTNAATPYVVANPASIDSVGIAHLLMSELVGQDEADRFIKIPTPVENLHSQFEENQGLLDGERIEVDPDDNDQEHMAQLYPLFRFSLERDNGMPPHVREAIWHHYTMHDSQYKRKQAQGGVRDQRAALQRQLLAPEAGGTQALEADGSMSPQRGGFSDAMKQTALTPGGQTPGENPGPADPMKYGRSGGTGRTTNQSQNMLQ